MKGANHRRHLPGVPLRRLTPSVIFLRTGAGIPSASEICIIQLDGERSCL